VANPEHLAKLKDGVDAWNKWRAAEPVTPDLTRAHLGGANLAAADLSGANLTKARLGETMLCAANLTGANLSGARLGRANLGAANLAEANLSGADISGANLSTAQLGRANLLKADLRIANLSQADLSGATLSWADLRGADLSGTALRGAQLIASQLRGADLSEADLSGADLSEADLSEADLSDANLSGAFLCKTNLRQAVIKGADFSATRADETLWADLDLSVASNLDSIRHAAPSTVGTDTIRKSKGRLAEIFLRGCGLSDWEVRNARLYDPDLSAADVAEIQEEVHQLLTRGIVQTSPVFLSHSAQDGKFADAIAGGLDELGVRYWRDAKDSASGQADKILDRGISLDPTVLIVVSKRCARDAWLDAEVRAGLELSSRLKRVALCLLALDDTWTTAGFSHEIKDPTKGHTVIDFAAWQNEDVFAERFASVLERLGLLYRKES
jgi:uncharacterized protein YjbI with pentapeptide repeats